MGNVPAMKNNQYKKELMDWDNIYERLAEINRPETEKRRAENHRRFLESKPEILICGNEKDECSCNELADKEVIYDETRDGVTRRYREMICNECYNENFTKYYNGITLIKVNNL